MDIGGRVGTVSAQWQGTFSRRIQLGAAQIPYAGNVDVRVTNLDVCQQRFPVHYSLS